MIKTSFFTGLSFFIALNCVGQSQKYFEGKIIYQHEFKSLVSNLDDKVLKNILGNGSILFFKEGNYYHEYDGGMFEFDLYNKADNKMYLKKRNNDTIYWSDCGIPGKKIKNFKFTAGKENILGIVCNQLIIQYEKTAQVHYYNSDSILTNPAWFTNFKLDGENVIDQKEKSIFLKSENEYDHFTMISRAVKISREKIPEKIFKIPANAILIKDE